MSNKRHPYARRFQDLIVYQLQPASHPSPDHQAPVMEHPLL